jgi:glycine/D-amino acid oxidase-like deaminating enzyme
MRHSWDIIIAGAGVIGLSAALAIARRSRLSILVLEQAASLGAGSTGASSAVCRFRYSQPAMIELARDGIAAYRNWDEFLGLADPLARYFTIGNLWLGRTPDDYSGDVEALTRLGVRADYLDDDGARELFPCLNPCPVRPDFETGEDHDCRPGGRHLFERDSGYIEPNDVLADLMKAVRAAGVEVRTGEKVKRVRIAGGRVTGVELASNLVLPCGQFLNTTGPWCNELLRDAGLADRWNFRPTRIQVIHLDRPSGLEGPIPICADPASGIYFRPQGNGRQIVLGSILPEDEEEVVRDPGDFATHADDDFIRAKLFALKHKLPALDYSERVTGYSGLYTINPADVHPVVGPTPIDGFFVANGFSGHGFKIAPAVGMILAQQTTDTRLADDTNVPHSFLAYDRDPLPVRERSVVA